MQKVKFDHFFDVVRRFVNLDGTIIPQIIKLIVECIQRSIEVSIHEVHMIFVGLSVHWSLSHVGVGLIQVRKTFSLEWVSLGINCSMHLNNSSVSAIL